LKRTKITAAQAKAIWEETEDPTPQEIARALYRRHGHAISYKTIEGWAKDNFDEERIEARLIAALACSAWPWTCWTIARRAFPASKSRRARGLQRRPSNCRGTGPSRSCGHSGDSP